MSFRNCFEYVELFSLTTFLFFLICFRKCSLIEIVFTFKLRKSLSCFPQRSCKKEINKSKLDKQWNEILSKKIKFSVMSSDSESSDDSCERNKELLNKIKSLVKSNDCGKVKKLEISLSSSDCSSENEFHFDECEWMQERNKYVCWLKKSFISI